MSHIKNLAKGIIKEFPVVRGMLEEYDSETIQKLNKQYQEGTIKNRESLIEAINNLNRNRGRELIVKRIVHVPKHYYLKEGIGIYREHFDADKLKVETKVDGNSKTFLSFLVSLKLHNDERDTTIHNVSLTAYTEKNKTTTIPDMIKLDDDKWEKFDIDELMCRISKNTSNRIYFRFISKCFFEETEVLTKLTLEHTSGKFDIHTISKLIAVEAIDDMKWAIGSSFMSGDSPAMISNNREVPRYPTEWRLH